MRKILFRGKRVDDGEWVEGYYYKAKFYRYDTELCGYITIPHPSENGRGNEHFMVFPETVGQYTGMRDCKRTEEYPEGQMIFEGDIVKGTIVRDLGGGKHTKTVIGIVGYDSFGMLGIILYYHDNVPVWSDVMCELSLSGAIDDFWFEVIGNIYDNSELIGGGENA